MRDMLLAAEVEARARSLRKWANQPRIVSKWRWRSADDGLAGLEDRPRAHKKPIYGAAI